MDSAYTSECVRPYLSARGVRLHRPTRPGNDGGAGDRVPVTGPRPTPGELADGAVSVADRRAMLRALAERGGNVAVEEQRRAFRALDDGTDVPPETRRVLSTMAVRLVVGLLRPPAAAIATGDDHTAATAALPTIRATAAVTTSASAATAALPTTSAPRTPATTNPRTTRTCASGSPRGAPCGVSMSTSGTPIRSVRQRFPCAFTRTCRRLARSVRRRGYEGRSTVTGLRWWTSVRGAEVG